MPANTSLRLLFALWLLSSGVAYAGPLGGAWTLDKDASDKPEKELKGLVVYRPFHRHSAAEARDTTESRYWEQQELVEKNRVQGAVADVGPIQQVLDATQLQIEDDGNKVRLVYDGHLRREFVPGDGGPVYSAKGVEYQTDDIGQSLAWREGASLVIETMLAPRGKMHEVLKPEGGSRRLSMTVTIENPDWLLPAKIRRVFDAAR